jgi:leucyl aminopeptidase (aminopeptidase T)
METLTERAMLKGAHKLLAACTHTQAGEQVLIVTDPKLKDLAEPLAQAAEEIGAEASICVMPARKAHGQEPPGPVAAAMAAADVFFAPVSVSITHTRAVKEAAQSGARGLVLTDFTPDMLVSGGIEADFEAQAPICHRLAAIFEAGEEVHLTTRAGTDLRLDASGRRGNALTCIVEAGQFSTVPTIEANFSPVEGSAQGVIVADASIPYLEIGLLEEPVRAEVRDGSITRIEGGRQARVLRKNLAGQGDPLVYNVAELGVGLNPKARLCGLMLEDEGVLGVVHIGIGTNITLGGSIKASVHYDLLMYGATLEVDGQVLLRTGELAPVILP